MTTIERSVRFSSRLWWVGLFACLAACDGTEQGPPDAASAADAALTTDASLPVAVDFGPCAGDEATDVVLSGLQTCVLSCNGAVHCFGFDLSPIALPTDLAPASQITMTRGLSGNAVVIVALRQGGYRIIGLNAPGDGTAWDLNGAGAATQMASGDAHACVLDVAGRTWCVGRNDAGQMGTSVDQVHSTTTPRELVEWGGPIQSLSAGGFSTCAIMGAKVRCAGQLGAANGVVADVPLLAGATRVAMGGSEGTSTACGLVGDQAKCTHVSFPAVPVTDITAGDTSACGLSPIGAAICAGQQYDYQAMKYVDAAPKGDVLFRSLRANHSLYCGIARDDARVRCWGAINGGWMATPVALP